MIILIASTASSPYSPYFHHIELFISSCHIDFSTITSRLSDGYYTSIELFINDINRIISNCILYNGKNSEYVNCANSLEKFFMEMMEKQSLWFDLLA